MISDTKTPRIEVYFSEGDDPFICGVCGAISANVFEDIEALFKDGTYDLEKTGLYAYWARLTPAWHDEPAYWELTEIEYRSIDDVAERRK